MSQIPSPEPLTEEGSGQEVDYSGDEDEESNVDATDTRSGEYLNATLITYCNECN